MISGIYTITNLVNNKIYVGSSTGLKNRLSDHASGLRRQDHGNPYLQKSYNKYGKENFRFEVLEEHDPDFLLAMENYWCNLLNTYDRNYGYNINRINPDNNSYSHSEATKKKISVTHLGIKKSESALLNMKKAALIRVGTKLSKDHKQKISDWNKGKIVSESTRAKLSVIWKGLKHSNESKRKMSESHKGKKLSKERIEQLKSNSHWHRGILGYNKGRTGKLSSSSVPVLQYDLNGNLIKEWDAIADAVKMLGLISTNISRVCKEKPGYKTAGGFIWKYKNNECEKNT